MKLPEFCLLNLDCRYCGTRVQINFIMFMLYTHFTSPLYNPFLECKHVNTDLLQVAQLWVPGGLLQSQHTPGFFVMLFYAYFYHIPTALIQLSAYSG